MLMLVAVLVGCDGHHDPLDTSMKVGHILCTDGKTRSYEDYVASGKEAIAVVFHVNRNEEMSGTGYAVYLHDLPPEAFADSLGISQGTSADLAAYDGNENTFALYDTDDVSSPMAMQVFDMWRYGQSALRAFRGTGTLALCRQGVCQSLHRGLRRLPVAG